MSHTASIKAVKIQSISALRAAVQELNEKHGIKCSLVENTKPRAYFQDQPGMGLAPFVLRLDDCKYDIGFYPDPKGGYEARTDFWQGHVEKVLGAQACSVASKEQAKLGKLFQSYGINAAMEQARKQGYTFRRQAGKDGAEQLIITGV